MNAAIAQGEIFAERERQVDMLGYSAEHDDRYTDGELLRAANCYRCHGTNWAIKGDDAPGSWPWGEEIWKPRDRARNLIKAGALVLAEKERRIRAGEPLEAVNELFDRIDRELIGTR